MRIGRARVVDHGVKLPAAMALGGRLGGVPVVVPTLGDPIAAGGRRRSGTTVTATSAVVSIDVYNGALSTGHCRRLTAALRHAAAQDTSVLLIRGGDVFCNGIHLAVIDAAPSPAMEAWRNIIGIDDVCREIIGCSSQLVVTALRGSAGAGGVIMALGADQVIARDGIVLNPHYRTMGLYGSEYWTYVLPRRVGRAAAVDLTGNCLPIGAAEAAAIGLVDVVLPGPAGRLRRASARPRPRAGRRSGLPTTARREAGGPSCRRQRKPLDAYRAEELAEMSRDLFDDRHGFAAARRDFVTKQKPVATPTAAGAAPSRGAHRPGRPGRPVRQLSVVRAVRERRRRLHGDGGAAAVRSGRRSRPGPSSARPGTAR